MSENGMSLDDVSTSEVVAATTTTTSIEPSSGNNNEQQQQQQLSTTTRADIVNEADVTAIANEMRLDHATLDNATARALVEFSRQGVPATVLPVETALATMRDTSISTTSAGADYTTVSAMTPAGTVETFKAKQVVLSDLYQLHVQTHGMQIVDSVDDDRRLFSALSYARGPSGNAEVAQRLGRIKTSAELRQYFIERNAAGGIHSMMDFDAERAKVLGAPARQESPFMSKEVRGEIESLVKALDASRMLDDAPDLTLSANTVEARAALLRKLYDSGVDVVLKNPSRELRAALGLVDTEAEFKALSDAANAAQAEIESGLLGDDSNATTSTTTGDPHALAEKVRRAAILVKQRDASVNPVTRCTKQPDQMFDMSARAFANELADAKVPINRLDLVMPIQPIVGEQALALALHASLQRDLYDCSMDELVYPSKLYLLLTGVAHPKMLLLSDVRLLYTGFLAKLRGTDMRPSAAQLRLLEQSERTTLKASMEAHGLTAVIHADTLADEVRQVHSKEDILAKQTDVAQEARTEFFDALSATLTRLQHALAAVNGELQAVAVEAAAAATAVLENNTADDSAARKRQLGESLEEASRAAMREVARHARVYALKKLHALELALLLYFEEYIPAGVRADLMTVPDEACEACTPSDAKHDLARRRAWLLDFRRRTLLVRADDFVQLFTLPALFGIPHADTDRVDAQRSWSPTFAETIEFVRFVSLKMTAAELDADSEKVERVVKKYVRAMHDGQK